MKKVNLLLLALALNFGLQAQESENSKSIQAWQEEIPVEKVVEWRRHIHQNPELSYQELETSTYVVDLLESFGNIDVRRPTETSVLGILKGAGEGPTVAFRADMDALPVHEETGLDFASEVPNVSHACGHDAHTAMLLGTAATLSKMRDKLNGTVYFLFQHAEEKSPGGAKEIVETGILDEVDAFFGMHVFPNHPAGHVGILPNGAASTTSDGFRLTITGKGSHGSMPHMGVDPIMVGAEIVSALQTIVSRNVAPGELAVVTVGKFQSGEAHNVVADKAELAATIRTTTLETRNLIEERVRSLIDKYTTAHDATYDLRYINGYATIMNNPELNAKAKTSALKALGEEKVFDAPMMSASEDFSYFGKVAPVSFMILGVGEGPVNHNPKFNIDEAALDEGITVQVQVLLDYLKN